MQVQVSSSGGTVPSTNTNDCRVNWSEDEWPDEEEVESEVEMPLLFP